MEKAKKKVKTSNIRLLLKLSEKEVQKNILEFSRNILWWSLNSERCEIRYLGRSIMFSVARANMFSYKEEIEISQPKQHV